MKSFIRLVVIAVACVFATVAHAETRIVGYYAGWSKRYAPADIPAEKLTHINYAFGHIKDGVVEVRNADEKLAGLVALKSRNKDLKILFSVGGWTDSGPFSDTALTDESRKKFAASCAEFVRKHKLDGIDIDWEFPGGGGADKTKFRPEDTQNFTSLLKELRDQLNAAGTADHLHYLLTIAGPAGGKHLEKIELAKIVPLLDFLNVMTYDFAGSWSEKTNFNAPLYSPANDPAGTKNNGDSAIRQYLAGGAPADKLVLGVPFYARAWGEVADVNHGLYQPHGKGKVRAVASGDEWTFSDIADHYLNQGATRYWSDEAKVPWLYDPKKKLMVSYDDPQSLKLKAEYVRDQKLGGIMIWELSQDDSKATLLTTIRDTLRK